MELIVQRDPEEANALLAPVLDLADEVGGRPLQARHLDLGRAYARAASVPTRWSN